jgi:hypothetical protein
MKMLVAAGHDFWSLFILPALSDTFSELPGEPKPNRIADFWT